jgi:hypothetical protein
MRCRSTWASVAAAAPLALALLVAPVGGASAAPGGAGAETAAVPTETVTRLLLDTPLTLDEVGSAFGGVQILELRYTGDVGGGSRPGWGTPTATAIQGMRQSVLDAWGFEPLISSVVIAGPTPEPLTATLGDATVFAVDDPAVELFPIGTTDSAAAATRARQASLGMATPASATPQPSGDGTQAASTDHAWAPLNGGMQAYSRSSAEFPAKFRHTATWYSADNIAAFGSDWGYEHNMTLYDGDPVGPVRPYCSPDAYTAHWAAWDVPGFKWNSVQWGHNFPSDSVPYFDWDDATDECSNLDFTIGVGYPMKLSAGTTYSFWIDAKRGAASSSPYELGAQRLSNDCNDAGMEPGSSCMGLNASRPGSATELLVNGDRGWSVPSCADWQREVAPTRSSNGINGCPSNT